jgi:hypothetical protein
MAEYQRIEYRIGKDGNIVETVIGGSGPSCTQTTTAIEAALGQVENRTLLPEHDESGEPVILETEQQSHWQ